MHDRDTQRRLTRLEDRMHILTLVVIVLAAVLAMAVFKIGVIEAVIVLSVALAVGLAAKAMNPDVNRHIARAKAHESREAGDGDATSPRSTS